MRSRSKQETVPVTVNTRGKTGASSGATTCNRTVPLSEVVNNFWGGNFPQEVDVDFTLTKTTVDEVTPGYFRKRKAGELLPLNPFSSETVLSIPEGVEAYSVAAYTRYLTEKCSSNSNMVTRFNQGSRVYPITPVKKPGTLLSTSAVNALAFEAHAKLKSQGMDVLTSMLESRQTLAMLAGARRKLLGLVKDAAVALRKKGKLKSLTSWKQFSSRVGSYWLEGRFGWRILYYDLLAINDYLDQRSDELRYIVGRASGEASRTYAGTWDRMPYTLTDSVRIGFPGILDLSRVGNSSVANTVWELIPFSLVVDMFFDVQERIISLSGTPLNVKELTSHSFISRVRTRESIVQAQFPDPDGRTLIEWNKPAVVIQRYEIKTRAFRTQPSLGLPTFRFNLGGYKPVDLAFLLQAVLSKR